MPLKGFWLLLVGIGLLFPSAALAQQYTVTDLGTLVDGRNSSAWAINALGQVVGSTIVHDHAHPFLWTDGRLQDLGILPGTSECRAVAINDRGQVVGPCTGRGFLWTADSGMTPLPIPTPNYPLGINGQGDIVGIFGNPPHAFLYRNGRFDDLGPGQAFAINDQDQIVGVDEHSARLWDDLGTHDLDDEGGWTAAYAISASGVIAGSSTRGATTNAVPSHAVLWTPYGISDLGTLGGDRAAALAMSGDLIVGRSVTAKGGVDRAFVYDINGPGYALDLNDLIPPNSGWILSEARGVNAAGQIVGLGQLNSMNCAFLLTPVQPDSPPR
jgi:probable HAF family extracellular repeat protein